MKITAFTQRRSRCQKSPTISLFPFLAVLICTMGALVPLLLAIARQARLQALQEATAKAAQQQVDVQTEREMAQWRIGELGHSRKRAEEQLSQARLSLGHVESHARRLRQEGDQLRAALEELEKSGTQSGRQRAELEGARKQVQDQIGQAQQQLAAAQQEAGTRRRSYAVIPYAGPHGTYRPPIYVECRADAIVLQPDGICLAESDFDEPIELGNPLDRALRAAREVLLAQKRIKGDGSDEPYPLLLVRPEGITAYYVARAAMKSWKSEIGYELVGRDWDLEFPKSDAEVGRAMRAAVADVREERRREVLLAAMLSSRAGAPAGRAALSPGVATPGLGAQGGSAISPPLPSSRGACPGDNSQSGYPGAGDAGLPAAQATGGGNGRTAGSSAGVQGRPDTGSNGASLSPDAAMATAVFGATKPARRESQVYYRAAPGGGLIREAMPDSSGEPSSSSTRRVVHRPGEWMPREFQPPRPPEDKDDLDGKSKRREEKSKCLADTRGENWGLPNAARGSVGITRPIRVRCSSNRLDLLPDDADDARKAVPFGERTEDAVDGFVSAVWEHMKTWGIAGRGMYWRPILQVEVTPDAEFRYAELKALLDNSGLIVQRKT